MSYKKAFIVCHFSITKTLQQLKLKQKQKTKQIVNIFLLYYC